ncbi:competence protein CoiA family protein [Kitasatospora aureofaciens]|uniref:competence protein CoiA family protein n=1 Tax=Kitasatospora aureofaciens TaxID=1894 RepID=UPI00131AF78B|nr:competence protein CoiA family protein [Kitasatospora aureofaciens]
MAGDKRRIQTAVLGDATSDDPLVLPMEAIELDAFRRRHAEDTFWCGLLLGGCGAQLTTKLYRDRACHFAHHPDPDGSAPVCGRSARGVESADHLYLKRDLSGWLGGQKVSVAASFPSGNGKVPGSVVELTLGSGGKLRAYLGDVSPDWTEPGGFCLDRGSRRILWRWRRAGMSTGSGTSATGQSVSSQWELKPWLVARSGSVLTNVG